MIKNVVLKVETTLCKKTSEVNFTYFSEIQLNMRLENLICNLFS